MSKKTLMVLVVLLAVLAGGRWMHGGRSPSSDGEMASAGSALLASVDLSTVHAIAIDDGSSTTHLERVEGIWCVAEQDNYPADFDRLRAMMLTIDGLETGPVVDEGADHLAEYGLAAGEEPAPLRITLVHEKGTTVLSLGKLWTPQGGEQPWGSAPGRYVRVDEGPVLLLKEDVRIVQADAGKWWDRSLVEVAPESIRRVEVGSVDDTFSVEHGTNGTFTLVGAPGGEEVDVAAANRLFGALKSLRAEKILPHAEESEAAFTNAITYKAEAEGATYWIHLGEARAELGDGKPVKVEVTAATAATPEQLAAATLANRQLNGRTFLIATYLAEPLGMKKDALMHKPEPAPATVSEPSPVPENPPAAESAAP
jgi:hypothetical protein